ncbi:alanine racemase Alr [Paenibacillus larvae subsp. larvae]|uniref:Alanine racemase n=1 Tax=Paenibacillus larvae subsp. larvae TaxID=147375 RepID=A0A2L1U9F6_9BACL|nr:alanine racemase [Paenibacillus larvae]AQT85409.1 alanine racemase [Paenibacillus larvae subsp. pulvifaciens]AQZ47407.1 alanine racemase [Paenibacillus larvae subsp. pulvifaciens]AVF24737.1 alanine racemase Alr [Paenibacillus larvae subsp. larvae]AVF29498.1 alanine racemase Alr [Paenibacillus larvae subsp. larvae]MBH0341794.1 alanine racemase [Paenibacillus larvae]
MDAYYRPTWVEVSLDALSGNLQAFRQALPDSIRIMAVVKADAYGHGAASIAREAIASGADHLAVAFLDEALQLREAGISAPILVLGYTAPDGLEMALKNNITLTVFNEEMLRGMELLQGQAEALDKRLRVHVKVDSGMHRIGLYKEEEAVSYLKQIAWMPHICLEGLFTHYACADEADKAYTRLQYEKFSRVVHEVKRLGIDIPYIHAGNSAAAIDTPELVYNMARLGIAMYGLYPSEKVDHTIIKLEPVMSLKTRMIHDKWLSEGSGISYGTIYHTNGEERIGTLPIGYADGFSRMLSTKANALIRGKRVPIVGRICMDQCMLNITGVPEAEAGDEVVLIGRQGDEVIPAEEIAGHLGTINYEVTCMMAHRIPRVYVKEGRIVEVKNVLHHHST